jgi:hypothetical protein
MTTRKKVWAVFEIDDEIQNLDSCLGYSLTLKEARRHAGIEFAYRFADGCEDPRVKIMRATFELSRSYLVRAMNDYGGVVEPFDYELKEIAEISPRKARAIYKAMNPDYEEKWTDG